MLVTILSLVHNATTLLFGVYVSAAFLGVRMTRRNVLTLLGFSGAVGVVYVLCFLLFGEQVTEQVYPLIVHLPLALFLTFYYKYKIMLSTLSVLTAYLCCQISNWVGVAVLDMTHLEWAYYSARIVVTVTAFVLLIRFVSDALAQLAQKSTKAILILGLMPFVYYLFDYTTGVYTSLLYSGLEVVAEFLGFILCIAYLLFLCLYFRQYEEKCEAEQRNQLMKMQQAQSGKEIEAIRRSERAVSILRHDMRHFLLSVSAFIENGELDKAQAYIREVIDATDATARKKYCQNEIVNMILSAHESEMRQRAIDFQYTIQLPTQLPFSDVDLTSILSNALENAMTAVAPLPPDQRHVRLDMHMNGSKMLLSMKNTFAQRPSLRDGLPQTAEAGHGFGTQSIRYVAEKLNGHCQFSIVDEWFVLQVIL